MKCDDLMLSNLIGDDTEATDDLAAHLSECRRCQNRLQELAADPISWDDAIEALRDDDVSHSIVIALDEELTHDAPIQMDQISLDFLEPPTHPELLGRIGNYEIERVIGSGGMGIVFKAFDAELHRPIAVKVLAPHLAHSGGARQRFAREAQSAAAVVHQNVVPIYNVDTTGKIPFIVMQYVGGESLQTRVDQEGPLQTEQVLRIAAQIANGLAAAHEQGLVHRDVKPGNILMGDSVDRVLISDFGLARAADDASVTRSGFIAGTPHYMSPEQANGTSVDARSDLFGLGSVLYFMCTGRPPFRADGAIGVLKRICHDPHRPVDEVSEHVPAELADLIDDLLQKDAIHRPQTSEAVAKRLNEMMQLSRQHSRKRRRKQNGVRSPRLIRSIVIGLLLLVGMGTGIANRNLLQLFSDPPALSPQANDSSQINKTQGPILDSSPDPAQQKTAQLDSPLLPTDVEAQREAESAISPIEQNPDLPQQEQLPIASPQQMNEVLVADLFYDEAFFLEAKGINAAISDLDQPHSNTVDPIDKFPSDSWHDEFDRVDAVLQTIESSPQIIN